MPDSALSSPIAFEEPRLEFSTRAPRASRVMAALDSAVELASSLRDLVGLRASILNGCAYCVDLHALDARARSETEQRLHAVAVWHEARSSANASEPHCFSLTRSRASPTPTCHPQPTRSPASTSTRRSSPSSFGPLWSSMPGTASRSHSAAVPASTSPADGCGGGRLTTAMSWRECRARHVA